MSETMNSPEIVLLFLRHDNHIGFLEQKLVKFSRRNENKIFMLFDAVLVRNL